MVFINIPNNLIILDFACSILNNTNLGSEFNIPVNNPNRILANNPTSFKIFIISKFYIIETNNIYFLKRSCYGQDK